MNKITIISLSPMMKDHLIRRILFGLVATCCGLSAADFAAVGPVKETKLPPEKHLGAVKVTFDLQPTTMSFDLPWHFCAVAENGLKLAWSWIVAPELQLPATRLSPNGSAGQYQGFTYDQTHRAYIVPRTTTGPEPVRFSLVSIYDDDYLRGAMWLVNLAFVIRDWNRAEAKFTLKLGDARLEPGTDFRFGFETPATGKDLVIWVHRTPWQAFPL
jgi:hypothetical protein